MWSQKTHLSFQTSLTLINAYTTELTVTICIIMYWKLKIIILCREELKPLDVLCLMAALHLCLCTILPMNSGFSRFGKLNSNPHKHSFYIPLWSMLILLSSLCQQYNRQTEWLIHRWLFSFIQQITLNEWVDNNLMKSRLHTWHKFTVTQTHICYAKKELLYIYNSLKNSLKRLDIKEYQSYCSLCLHDSEGN